MATAPADVQREHRWERIIPWIILALVLLVSVVAATRWDSWTANRSVQTTDYASIQSDVAVIDAKISGYVRQVAFSDFQQVRAGELLVQLDDREQRAGVLHAEAALARARAVLANLDNEIPAAQATIAQAQAAAATNASKLRLAGEDDRRFSALADTGAVTGQEADSARANFAAVQATQQGSLAAVELQRRQLDVLRGQRAQREADVLAAQAALETARIALSYTRIVAPADGAVGGRMVQPGSLVNPGAAVVNFVPRSPPYVVANYKETQLARVRPGQIVTIEVDSFPGEAVRGRVSRLAPASGATFTTLPADNATGNFTKVTQRVPVRIDLDAGQPLVARLRAGLSVTTHIDTERGA
ncbi:MULTISPECIES: HlyD family secretion protein [unclassified Sphingomonas]|uniref:HlyD family secretion protein n=1 Tax=unclassified Sphingomonas TaxID=196159 RepID=UPI00104C3388|nr:MULTISPECIES: HlyD family secretion protein [unclassified Sphingomonas]MBB3349513.1 membrane fusion protein (multidrug efflux system) [Sphingomonas sp. BK069]TCP32445.1 membrane fusion protein (multidrug efflux system) [Sphingomonas sp. BK235]